MEEEFSSTKELILASDKQLDAATLKLIDDAKIAIKKQLNADVGHYPSDDPQLFRYRKHFLFFEPPMTDTNGYIRKNCICLNCFRGRPTDLKLFKGTRVGFYNHLSNRHMSAFKEVQKIKEPVLRDSTTKSVPVQNNALKKKTTTRKRKKTALVFHSEDEEEVEEIVQPTKGRSRRRVATEPLVIDTFSIGATISLPANVPEIVARTFIETDKTRNILDESYRRQHEKSDLLLVKLSLSLKTDMLKHILTDDTFLSFIDGIIHRHDEAALNYKIPSIAKIKSLQGKISNYLIRLIRKRITRSALAHQKEQSFISLIVSLRRLNEKGLSIFTVTVAFLNKDSWQVEVWNILETSFQMALNLNVVATLVNLLNLLHIYPEQVAHIYCDLELLAPQQSAELYLSKSPTFLSLLSDLKATFSSSRLLETSVSSMLGDILDLRGYGIVPVNLLPGFLTWVDTIQRYLPQRIPKISVAAISNLSFSLRLPELLENLLNFKSQICIAGKKANADIAVDSLQNWQILEQILCIMKPFVYILNKATSNNFSKAFVVPWLLFTEKYLARTEYMLLVKIDGVTIERSVIISSETVRIVQGGMLQKVQGYIEQVILGTEGDHLVLFSVLDPRSKDFLLSDLCIEPIVQKARQLVNRVMLTHATDKVKVRAEIEAYLKTPYFSGNYPGINEFSELFQRMEPIGKPPLQWFRERADVLPILFSIVVMFLPFSFVTLSENELLDSQKCQAEKYRDEKYKQTFLRKNWRLIEDPESFIGSKSLLSAIEFSNLYNSSEASTPSIDLNQLELCYSNALLKFI